MMGGSTWLSARIRCKEICNLLCRTSLAQETVHCRPPWRRQHRASQGDTARLPQALTRQECSLVRQLIQEAVPTAFEKCIGDRAVRGWRDQIQSDILLVRGLGFRV